ncbi:hypothetical protein EDB80DRAFT_678194 [Ilyonectria destructans]|nr:hypothetical protein EDB80DRAFT_678194 [Ilyonectria destructans]
MPRTRGELRRDGSLHGGNRELSTTAFQRLLSVAQGFLSLCLCVVETTSVLPPAAAPSPGSWHRGKLLLAGAQGGLPNAKSDVQTGSQKPVGEPQAKPTGGATGSGGERQRPTGSNRDKA